MKSKHLLRGIFKSIPGIEKVFNFHKQTGGTNNARYCYSVWLRHLIYAHKNGIIGVPKNIAELGPGDSLGIGLAALLSGSEKYYAFDVVKYANTNMNLAVFNELRDLFSKKTPLSSITEFPNLKPKLDNYDFPSEILSDDHLEKMLNKERIEKIRNAIQCLDHSSESNAMITYKVPWSDNSIIETGTLDMIFSQAVLECVDDLETTYKVMNKWLKPNGIISHCIDLKFDSADNWYEHWTFSDLEWKIVKGRKKYFINRMPYSAHIKLMHDNGFAIICDVKTKTNLAAKRNNLAKPYKHLSDEDLTTSGTFIQAQKTKNL